MNNQLSELRVLLSHSLNQMDDLASAASLAKTLKLTLKGIYLEDENLISAAELPLSSDISYVLAKEREFNRDFVSQTLKNHARYQQKELKKVAENEQLEYAFDVARGDRASWVLENIKANCLLFITHQNVISHSFQTLNYSGLKKYLVTEDTVKVLFSGSDSSLNALNVAARIAKMNHKPLTVLLDANTFDDEIFLREQLNNHLIHHENISVNAELLNTQNNPQALSQQLYTLVYPVDISQNNEFQLLFKLLKHLHRPLILVR